MTSHQDLVIQMIYSHYFLFFSFLPPFRFHFIVASSHQVNSQDMLDKAIWHNIPIP
ncbi:hypothetical protein BDV40DRAFT_265012 [Aspergillus tamarii]|uniref:Uncharacterized protein n=1 Tax=Aspergillus tamarii TaxID=41984 RepID=A0A5N6UUW3_ASPTM|nr:hypothetical protein BDV40DRAFT_265012 [Aspergillus tamarii]